MCTSSEFNYNWHVELYKLQPVCFQVLDQGHMT